MLGNKLGILLVIAVISFSTTSEIFADEIFVEFDKSEYNTGEILILSGTIEGFSMPIVAVSIYDPNEKILSANNLELDIDGNFYKIISLDSPFYDRPGDYKVKIDYRQISKEAIFTILSRVRISESQHPNIESRSSNKNFLVEAAWEQGEESRES